MITPSGPLVRLTQINNTNVRLSHIWLTTVRLTHSYATDLRLTDINITSVRLSHTWLTTVRLSHSYATHMRLTHINGLKCLLQNMDHEDNDGHASFFMEASEIIFGPKWFFSEARPQSFTWMSLPFLPIVLYRTGFSFPIICQSRKPHLQLLRFARLINCL